jgi:hypothetical protein
MDTRRFVLWIFHEVDYSRKGKKEKPKEKKNREREDNSSNPIFGEPWSGSFAVVANRMPAQYFKYWSNIFIS